MKINSLNYLPVINVNTFKNYKEKDNLSQNYNYGKGITKFPIPFLGTIRVDKSMARFYDFNEKRLPTTVKSYLASLQDKLSVTPLEAQKKAFLALNNATSIDNIQEELFPDEELFYYLKPLKDSKATKGLLGVYRDFKELYENGILNNGEEFTIYLLKKLFIEAKTLGEINNDLDNDLIPDIKSEFKRRYPDSEYLKSSTLKSLGIYLSDKDYQNSLRFTRDGYSDEIGLKISQGQLRYWNSLTEEQKFDILSKRCEGRDNWWNNLTYDEKLELAAGVDSDDDLYKNYRRFVNARKKELRENSDEKVREQIALNPNKKIKVGSKLKDKDIFNLWFKKNIEKFYALLSEADKDSVHIKRVRKLVVRWQSMTPEERTDLINKIKSGREPGRYVMIDAWNHSRTLIRELSDFLKAQQILKPVDLLYSDEEFSEFQSKVMTEFWAQHRDLAEEFGVNIKRAQIRVEEAINSGKFEDLKAEIERDRDERKRILERERLKEEEQKTAEKNTVSSQIIETAKTNKFKTQFAEGFKDIAKEDKILPQEFYLDMLNILLKYIPDEHFINIFTDIKNKHDISNILDNIEKHMPEEGLLNKRKIENALEAAIANEMNTKGTNPAIFKFDVRQLREVLAKKLEMEKQPEYAKLWKVDKKRILKLYNEYKKDLTEDEVSDIMNGYFSAKDIPVADKELSHKLANYIRSFGRSALILFSNKSVFGDNALTQFNIKFLEEMPQDMRDRIIPHLQTADQIKNEKVISHIRGQIAKRFSFVPDEPMNIYTKEVASAIRFDEIEKIGDFSINKYKAQMVKPSTKSETQGFLTLPKNCMSTDHKLKMLAIEEAMADELYKVTKDSGIYSSEFEELCCFFELLSFMRNSDKGIHLYNEDKTKEFYVKSKPKINMLLANYKEYLNDMESRDELIVNDEVNLEELLCSLNPDENDKQKDEYVMQRIKRYFS